MDCGERSKQEIQIHGSRRSVSSHFKRSMQQGLRNNFCRICWTISKLSVTDLHQRVAAVSQVFRHRLGRWCTMGGASHYNDNSQQHGNRGALLRRGSQPKGSASINRTWIHTVFRVSVFFFFVVQIGRGTYATPCIYTRRRHTSQRLEVL